MLKNPVQPLYRFILKETINPQILFNTMLIGGSINWFAAGNIFATPMGFVIPFLVQVYSRASVKYKNRFQALLAMLPLERNDPAFVMDPSGKIVLAMGKTHDYFQSLGVSNLAQYLSEAAVQQIVEHFHSQQQHQNFEFYSDQSHLWYVVKVKRLVCTGRADSILVWMDDISPIKRLHERIFSISNYSDHIIRQLDDFTQKSDIYQRLAPFILGMGYEAAFIALKDLQGNWIGQASRYEGESLILSDDITLEIDSSAPILLSRKEQRLVLANRACGISQEDFEKKYPFDPRIKSFVGKPIGSFINYHQGDTSIIAFNKPNQENQEDELFLHTLMNTSHSLFFLADLAIKNEEQFLQKVMGLCSAAEFSDEITGKHILRVNRYANLLAEQLKMPPRFVRSISQVAALHDIGKVAMPELIKFTGKYSPEQREEMQMHTVFGAQIIQTMINFSSEKDTKLEIAYNIALHHHQSYNGMGYPSLMKADQSQVDLSNDLESYRGLSPLKGDIIPIEALIAGLADSYDALRSARQYKPEFSHEKAWGILSLDDRTGITGLDRFGPQVWPAFLKIQDQMDLIFQEMRS